MDFMQKSEKNQCRCVAVATTPESYEEPTVSHSFPGSPGRPDRPATPVPKPIAGDSCLADIPRARRNCWLGRGAKWGPEGVLRTTSSLLAIHW